MPETSFSIPDKVRNAVMLTTALVVLGFVNFEIAGKEKTVQDGRVVLLRLAPRDPRSLLQGDYMALRYSIADQVASAAREAGLQDGHVILELSDQGEAAFVAVYSDQQLGEDQQLLRFRRRGDSIRLASDAFFFEEGQFERYAAARFGELRVAENGNAVLVGLRDANGARLGASQQSGSDLSR